MLAPKPSRSFISTISTMNRLKHSTLRYANQRALWNASNLRRQQHLGGTSIFSQPQGSDRAPYATDGYDDENALFRHSQTEFLSSQQHEPTYSSTGKTSVQERVSCHLWPLSIKMVLCLLLVKHERGSSCCFPQERLRALQWTHNHEVPISIKIEQCNFYCDAFDRRS